MKTYRLTRSQQLPCDIHVAWAFFSAPGNLARITPPDMKFTVRTPVGNQPIYEGMRIDYYVSPLFGIRLKWQTEITHVDHERSFTDIQKKGPYRLWHHHHEFIPNNGGVLMHDTVDYQLPFWMLGNLIQGVVQKKLNHIFDFRHQVLTTLFTEK
ncbi:hypothetical protein ACFQRK_09030 [Parapedobacter sp. GCM10030251]|uniref:SRPBCC family protein n=1 Tax=Parapedobacter sp. GCM10030251 TaxID=3273419 RepID=UPI00361E2631